MPDFSTLIIFGVASLALTVTPGPDMLLIASRSMSQGRAAGLVTLAGIQVGTYFHALAAALGLSQLFVLVPMAYDVVRWIGALYLAYLAWRTLRADAGELLPNAGGRPHALGRIFGQGLLTNLLNPKMALFVLALFPQFLKPEAGAITGQILVLATVLNAIGLVTNGVVIVAASRLGHFLAGSSRTRWPNYFLSMVFGGLALRLAASARP